MTDRTMPYHRIEQGYAPESITLLPKPSGSSFSAAHVAYLKDRAEVVLKDVLRQLREGTLTWDSAACSLGRIAGYYDLLAEVEREQRKREEQRPD